MMTNKLLLLAPGILDELRKKGVAAQIGERDVGFFDRVYSVHMMTPTTETIVINEKNIVIEISVRSWQWLRIIFPLNSLIIFAYLLKKVLSLVKKEKINVIRATDPYLDGFMALCVSKLMKIPYCVSIHADYAKRYKLDPVGGAPLILGSRRVAEKIERFVLAHADMVLPIRRSLGDYALARGANPSKIRIIPHGVKTELFDKVPDPEFKNNLGVKDQKILCFVGRISQENYVYDLISLMAQINKKRNDVKLLIIGDGPETAKLKEEIARQGLEAAVKLLGFKPFHEVVEFRKIADINLCLMGGFSLIEAALSGRPVIAYDVEWHAELIENNVSGILVKENDISALAAAVLQLLENVSLAEKIGAAARQKAKNKHSFQLARHIVSDCYRQLIEGHP